MDEATKAGGDERERLSLSDALGSVLDEARMILPGTQTLFGFQLIVVFDSRFQDHLSLREQYLHLAAIGLVAITTGLLVTPAAYHRRVEPASVSRRFVALSTRLLRWSLVPLALAMSADLYLVTSLVVGQVVVSAGIALTLLAVLLGLWVVLPALAAADEARGEAQRIRETSPATAPATEREREGRGGV